ncbi:PAAR domain-containing protein, partial [Yersinia proxima]
METTQSGVGQVMVNYGVNGKDVVTTSMIIARLGDFGIRATVYVNHKGTELIKLTGYAGIRKVLTAPVFALKNPKVVDLGIGKYGLKNSIISGARLTFYVAAAYRT